MTKRKLRYSGLGLAVFTAGAIVACGGDDGGTPGGTAGAGAGGKPGIAGAPATAGAQPTAGAAGSVTAGAGGGGSAGSPGFACGTTMPTAALITDFSNLTPSTTNAGDYTFAGGVLGGTFSYQAGALTLNTMTNTVLNVKGNVKAYDGFGLYFNTCYDASAYTGISFSVKGYAGPKGKLNFRVQTNSNTAIDMKNMKGQCVATAADTYAECHASSFDIPVTSTATVVTVMWNQLSGGVPVSDVTGNNIVGLEWAFDWTPGVTGAAGAGAGGAGAGGAGGAGAGGASAGGTGGANAGSGGANAGSGGAKAGSGGASGGSGGASAGSGGASAGSGGAPAAAGPYDADVTIDDVKFLGGPPAGGAGGASAGGASSGGASSGAGGASAGSGGASAGSGGASAGSGGKAGGGGTAG